MEFLVLGLLLVIAVSLLVALLIDGGPAGFEEYDDGPTSEQVMLHGAFLNERQMQEAYPELYPWPDNDWSNDAYNDDSGW